MGEEDAWINTYADIEPVDADIQDAMDMSWEEGLSEIESFFDVDLATQNASAGAEPVVRSVDDGGQHDAEAEKDGAEDALAGWQPSDVQPSDVDEMSAPPPPSQTLDTQLSEAATTDRQVQSITSPVLEPEEDDRMAIEHVTPPSPHDATSTEQAAQPHFTGDADPGLEPKSHSDNENAEQADVVTTRPRQSSMQIDSVDNPEAEGQQRTAHPTDHDEATSLDNPESVTESEVTTALEVDSPPPPSDTALPFRPSPPQAAKTPGSANFEMTPSHPPTQDAAPPSSDGKSSLLSEMRREDDHAFPPRRRSSIEAARYEFATGGGGEGDDEGGNGEDGEEESDQGSLADAASSPVDLRERLREARGERKVDGYGDGDVGEEEDEEVENGGLDVGEEDWMSALEDWQTGVAVSGGVAEVSMVSPEQEDDGNGEANTSADGRSISARMPTNEGESASKASLLVEDNPIKTAHPVDGAEKSTATATKKKPKTATSKPQTRQTRSAAAGAKAAPEAAVQTAETATSEDELASASPRTVPRKRKASDENKIVAAAAAAAGKGGRAAKRARTTSVAAPMSEELDNAVRALSVEAAEKQGRSARVAPWGRPLGKAKARPSFGVGVNELKGLTETVLGAEGGGGGDDAGGRGARKTRARVEAEKRAVPNAREAVRARRKGM